MLVYGRRGIEEIVRADDEVVHAVEALGETLVEMSTRNSGPEPARLTATMSAAE